MKPSNITVGPSNYQIKFVKLDTDDMARISFKTGAIEIDSSMPEQTQKQSLCHEIGHAILRSRKLENDEVGVESLGDALIDVVQNNPAVIKWLTKKG